jgi:hypothetical protein
VTWSNEDAESRCARIQERDRDTSDPLRAAESTVTRVFLDNQPDRAARMGESFRSTKYGAEHDHL